MNGRIILLLPMAIATIDLALSPKQTVQTSTQDTAIVVEDHGKLRLKRDDEPPFEVEVQYGTWHTTIDSTWFEPDVPVIIKRDTL